MRDLIFFLDLHMFNKKRWRNKFKNVNCVLIKNSIKEKGNKENNSESKRTESNFNK